tara:strand:+ start:381 stop:1616 length:1236 start_codon:yes stop_codon:yes gene_type:complete
MANSSLSAADRFRFLAGVALSDGVLSPGEAQLLLSFANRLGLSRHYAGDLLIAIREGQALIDLPAGAGSDELFEDLVQMVFADGRASATEIRYVQALAESCGYPPQRVRDLVSDAMTGVSRRLPERAPVDRIANYALAEELGRGAAGVVYRGRHSLLQREAAIKLFPVCEKSGPAARRTFLREVKAAAKLVHPHILPTLDAGEADGLPYLVMELVPQGETFQRRLDRGQDFGGREAAEAVATVARAVHYAHGEGLLHRDLKPANVLVPRDGRPRLGDFGLVSERGEEASCGRLVGTPPYMSPEQISGKAVDPRSDVYGLGATLYALLTGHPPFSAEGLVELAVKVVQEQPLPPSARRPGVPPALDAVCLRCLEKSPNDRYANAGALASDLERVAAGSLLEKISRRLRRRKL